jgi:hypothetical protein
MHANPIPDLVESSYRELFVAELVGAKALEPIGGTRLAVPAGAEWWFRGLTQWRLANALTKQGRMHNRIGRALRAELAQHGYVDIRHPSQVAFENELKALHYGRLEQGLELWRELDGKTDLDPWLRHFVDVMVEGAPELEAEIEQAKAELKVTS